MLKIVFEVPMVLMDPDTIIRPIMVRRKVVVMSGIKLNGRNLKEGLLILMMMGNWENYIFVCGLMVFLINFKVEFYIY